MTEDYPLENGMRIIQETVPGRQVTLAHIIASPDPILYQKLGLDPSLDYDKAAIGISTVTPSETDVYKRQAHGWRHQNSVHRVLRKLLSYICYLWRSYAAPPMWWS